MISEWISIICILGHLSVIRGIIHHFLPRNSEQLLGYFLKGEEWIPIPYSEMSPIKDNGSKCQSVFLWKCVSEIFDHRQIMLLNWIYYNCLEKLKIILPCESVSKKFVENWMSCIFLQNHEMLVGYQTREKSQFFKKRILTPRGGERGGCTGCTCTPWFQKLSHKNAIKPKNLHF